MERRGVPWQSPTPVLQLRGFLYYSMLVFLAGHTLTSQASEEVAFWL